MQRRTAAFFIATGLQLLTVTGAPAQNISGKWKVDFGAWSNEVNPEATAKFVQSGKLTFIADGDSLLAMFHPDYENVAANAGAPVPTDTLRGSFRNGRLLLTGSRVMKTRRMQNGAEDEGESSTAKVAMNMDLAIAGEEITGTMRMEIGAAARLVAPLKMKRIP